MASVSRKPLHGLSFLLPAPAPGSDSRAALHDALQLIALGESLGYTGAWVPWQGPDDAVWSAVALLAAATQHTQLIELGAHDVPVPEVGRHDLPAADLLSRRRFQLGLESGDRSPTPSYPGSDGLAGRIWVEAADVDGARRAAAAGRHLFISSRLGPGDSVDPAAAQADLVHAYLEGSPVGARARIAVGRVVLPLDSADASSRQLLRDLSAATHTRGGDRQVPALVGPSEDLVARLVADPALGQAGELRLELPRDVHAGVRAQILHDVAEYLAPELGWQAPAHPPVDLPAMYI